MTTTARPEIAIHVPDEAFADDEPLVAVMRGDYVGSLHRGQFAVAGADGRLVAALGDAGQSVYLRSAAKPFQVMPAVLAGAIDRFGLSPRELAVLCASHSAEPLHTDTVLGILHKIGLDEGALHCGVHPPIDEATALARARAGLEPTPVCNNCSGAHAGMLAACQANGWPIDDYGTPEHPLQQQTRAILASFAGLPPDEVHLAVDNCHVPAFRLPLHAAARAFAQLVQPEELSGDIRAAAGRVVDAMTSFPEMVGGTGRFDTDLMTAVPAVVAKGGAEGFQAIGVRNAGLGLALKVSDGNARAIPPAVLSILDALGLITAAELETLQAYLRPETRDMTGDVVGHIEPVFRLEARA